MTTKQSQRMAYASDCATVHARMIHEFHASVAEEMLKARGVLPELIRYLEGLRRAAK